MEENARLREVTEEEKVEVEDGDCSQLEIPEIRKAVIDILNPAH